MCGLECDVCKQKLPLAENTTPTICIFPCFHKYCERCKAQVLASARPQHGAESRVSCKLCNQHFLLNVLYDYSENQIEKIFCLHCNIKNKAPVEWRCKSCENRYLCAHCSQPHYHSGHELEPVMKPSIPLRSQCTSHSNVLATYLCSCQARLCDYCLNNHADGSTEHPHEQRIAYTKLAERARTELETIRRQSIRDTEKIESLKEKVATNKKQIGIQATQARTAVANEVVELVNAIIRRGNDIVTCIDSTEETKIKNCGQLEKEMQHWLDRLTKIESFTQSALFTTVQQDHPGMWSASMFSQSALFQVNKRRDLAKNTLEQFERSPIISYQSWSTKELFSAIRSFGLLNLDGEIKIPAQSTPQNAHMFSISNSFTQSNSNSNTSNNATDTPPVQQQQNKRPIPPTQNVPPIIRSTSNHSNASTSQQHAVNFSGSNSNIQQQQPLQQQPQRISTPSAVIMTLSSPPPNIQQNPPSIHHPIPQQQHNIGGPNLHHSEIHHISVSSPTPIIPQLLQQPLNVSGSRFVQQHPQQHPQQQPQQQQPPQHHPQRLPQLLPLNCPLPVVGSPPISLPNTPLTPVMHGPPDQMQIMRQNIVLQQQQHIGQQQLQQQPHQQQQRSIQQQQPCLPHRQPPPPQFRMQQIPQNHAGPMPHQIQQQNICQNSQQSMFNQQQPHQQPPPHIIQQQQMQQHQHYMTAQRLHLQQQQLMLSQQYHPQVMSPPFQQQQPQQHIVHVLDSPHNQQLGNNNGGQEDRPLPPIISRIPNPRLNAQQFVDSVIGQNLTSVPSATENHPPQHYQNSGVTPLEHLVEMTSASTMPQQTSSRNFENLPAHISHKQSTSSAIPEIVDLLDDEEEEGQNKNNSSCQELEASINRLITVPIATDIIINSEKIEKINDNLNLLQQQDSAIQQLQQQQQQNSNNSPHLLKALRQNKPQSAAADSTVSFAGNNSTESPSTVAPINTNSGTKRKPASINIDDGEQQKQKRIAKEINNKILNLNNNEEKRPVNISPPADLITTTTEENGEGGGGEDFDNKEENNDEQKLGKLKTSRKSETPNSLDLRVFSSPEEQNAEEVATQHEKMNEKISINSKTGKISTINPLTSNNEEASCSNNKKSEGKNSENVGNNNKTEESRNATSDDFWDDYCYVCSQGCDETTGSLGCCESCPRVFHSHCHVPRIKGYMEDLPDDWRCSVCVECEPLTVQTQEFGYREQLLCAKVFLACFEDNSQVELFVNQVPQSETDYHSVINHPIWLQRIGEKINFKSYTNVSKFLDDMNLLFQNFSTFNSPSDPLATKGKSVYTRYIQAVKKFMPFYQKQIWIYVSLYSTRFNSTQATTSSSLNLPMEEDNVEHNNRNRLIVKGTTVGRKRGGSKAKSQTPA